MATKSGKSTETKRTVQKKATRKAAPKRAASKPATKKKTTTKRAVKRTATKTPRTRKTATQSAPVAPLTLSAETPHSPSGIPPHILIFSPGFMGSKLRDTATGEIVWLDFSTIPLNPFDWDDWLNGLFEKMRYPNANLVPDGIVEDVLFLPPLFKQEQYSRLLKMLRDWGYVINPSVGTESDLTAYTFAYDWRQDNRISGKQLAARVAELHAQYPNREIWLMGHSNGGIISRWCIEKEGGKDIVSRLILLASPWDGAAKGLHALLYGFDMFLRWGFDPAHIGERTCKTLRGFPNIYTLLPQARAFVTGPNGELLDPFEGDKWLHAPELYAMLADGKAFNQELGNALSVETLAFFGRKLLTTTGAQVTFDANAHWNEINFVETELGDGTVPEYSASFPHAKQNIPVVAEHGSVYTNSAVQEILRWELLDKYTGAVKARAAATTDRFTILFNPDKNHYRPGETISIRAAVTDNAAGQPYAAATLFAELIWIQSLPGSANMDAPKKLPDTQLMQTNAGTFEGQLVAPDAEGYYALRGTVMLPGEPDMVLDEIIAIEKM